MAVFTEQSVRANIRNLHGRRVFYLAEGDRLTPSAREWLRQERIEVLPVEQAGMEADKTLDGGVFPEKPEHLTHLCAHTLVRKDHPRIILRGKLDALEAELLLAAKAVEEAGCGALARQLDEILAVVRRILRCDVLEEPIGCDTICGLTMEQLRQHSHTPQQYYDQPHFMPERSDSWVLLRLNHLRTSLREAELAIYQAFQDREGRCTREDLLLTCNRLSSLMWILMIRRKKEESNGRA